MADGTEGGGVGARDEALRYLSARPQRVLALEVRPQKIGFVVFDGATKVTDWGVSWTIAKRSRRSIAEAGIRRLLDRYFPAMIVMRPSEKPAKTADAVPATLAIIRAEARRRSVRCRTVHAPQVKRFYARLGCTTKHEIALLMAEWFEELVWIIPPKRKAWHREHHRTCVFDAAAAGAFVFGTDTSTQA